MGAGNRKLNACSASTCTNQQRHCVPLLECPLILPPDFLLLLRGEVIFDVECLANLLGGLALDHVSYGLAGQIQQILDVQIVCCLQS